jgi:hypothetical protein
VILVDAMQRGETVNSVTYIRMLTELRKRFKWVRPYKNPTEVLLEHDSASPHASLKTWEAITKFGEQCYPIHPTALI